MIRLPHGRANGVATAASPDLVDLPWHHQARIALRTSRIVVLVGAPGAGKTAFVQDESHRATGLPAEELQGGPKVDDVAFFGRYVLERDTTPFRDGPLTRALKAGTFFVLNDAGQVPFAQLSALLPLRHGNRIVNPLSLEEIAVPDSFRVILTTNQENASCRNNATAMQSLLDGALVVDVPDPTGAQMRSILVAHCPDATPEHLARVQEVRSRFHALLEKSDDKQPKVSVRALMQLLELLRAGMNERDAVAQAVVGKFLLDRDRHEAARLTASLL